MKLLLKLKCKNGETNTLVRGDKLLEQEVASIAKRIYDISKVENIYFDEVEEGFSYPSFYFPPVEQEALGDTLMTFKYDNALFVKVFGKSTTQAMSLAHSVVDALTRDKNRIAFVKKDGTYSGDRFRTRDISYKSIDKGVAQIYFRWSSVHEYVKPIYSKTVKTIFNLSIKEVL